MSDDTQAPHVRALACAHRQSARWTAALTLLHFAHAKTIVLVQDNLSIHSKASLYEAFPAVEARRLVERFEWHWTPKHGSWLNLAESVLGVLTSQCLDRRTRKRRCPQFRLLLLTRRHRKFASRVPVRESTRTSTQPAYLVAMTRLGN
jgi:hypothetical protein